MDIASRFFIGISFALGIFMLWVVLTTSMWVLCNEVALYERTAEGVVHRPLHDNREILGCYDGTLLKTVYDFNLALMNNLFIRIGNTLSPETISGVYQTKLHYSFFHRPKKFQEVLKEGGLIVVPISPYNGEW